MISMGLVAKYSENGCLNLFGFGGGGKEPEADIYAWGNGFYQARPDQKISFENFQPILIQSFLDLSGSNIDLGKIIQVAWSDWFGAVLNSKGKVAIYDNNKVPSSSIDSDSGWIS